MTEDTPLYTHLAAAYQPLFSQPLQTFGEAELAALIALGHAAGLRLHRFKRTMGLARVHKVLGLLHSLAPDSLLEGAPAVRSTFIGWPAPG